MIGGTSGPGSLGFITFEESESRPALGMRPGSWLTEITFHVTEEGWAGREAYWDDVNAAVQRLKSEREG